MAIFVNRVLNMRHIKYIGLDMDHTLVRYRTRVFEAKVFQLVIEHLIVHRGYPAMCRALEFDFGCAIRGLVVDCRNGNILKLSRYGSIRQSYHGITPIKYIDQKKFYRSTYVDLSDPNFIAIDTSFSISACVLYAQLVSLKDQFPTEFGSYEEIATDVLQVQDIVHSDGSLKSSVCQDPASYIIQDPALVTGIKRYQKHGKKIFLLTNSDYRYTQKVLEHAIQPYMPDGESWQSLFEYVITLASKPRFFIDDLRFLAVDPQTGLMSNVSGDLKPGVYQGGCAKTFTEQLKLAGDDILYVGDHIYGDILRLKKSCNWRTALVIEELGHEIDGQQKAQPIEAKIEALMAKKHPLEREYIALSSAKIDQGTNKFDDRISRLLTKIAKIDEVISTCLVAMRKCFNSHWDRVFRAGAEESFFAQQVNRFACIYMERIGDLLEESPRNYYRATRRQLTHEMDHNTS